MRVLNFGSLNIDYVYKVDHILLRGETLLANERSVYAGGKGLNQSVALGRAGLDVYHAGNIGQEGDFLLRVLRESHVNSDLIRVKQDIASGHTVIQIDSKGENCILLFGGANQSVTKEQITETLAHFDSGDVLFLQNEINCLAEIIEKAYAKGMRIVLNPSPINDQIGTLPLDKVDYFFVNELEAGFLTGTHSRDKKDLVPAIQKRFPNSRFILTLGSAGSCYIDGKTVLYQDIFRVKPVDSTAAGDTFSSYFMAGILRGDEPEESLRIASKAAAIAVSMEGAAPSIPTMQEVESFSV